MNESNDTERLIEQFGAHLSSKRLRHTWERESIARVALGLNTHFTVDELLKECLSQSITVSRATVYNTMDLMLEAKVLQQHTFKPGHNHYERTPAAPMVHVVCQGCGKVKLVRDTSLEAYLHARKYQAFTTSHYELYVYGLCNTCLRRLKRGKSQSKAPAAAKRPTPQQSQQPKTKITKH